MKFKEKDTNEVLAGEVYVVSDIVGTQSYAQFIDGKVTSFFAKEEFEANYSEVK